MTQENEMAAGAALPDGQEERLFTQAELEGILRERLERERSKYADYEQLREKAAAFDAAKGAESEELQKANERAEALQKQLDDMAKAISVRDLRQKVARESGVPAELLNGETEESCLQQAQAILAFAKPSGYPAVRDGGEPAHKPSTSASQQFADWFKQTMD